MRVPVSGGQPQKIAATEGPPIITRNAAYWLDRRVFYNVRRAKGVIHDDQLRGYCRLMATSIAGGSTRVVAASLPPDASIGKTEEGIAWSTAIPGVPGLKRITCLREGSTEPAVTHDVPYDVWALGNVYNGRVYWLELQTPVPTPRSASNGGGDDPIGRDSSRRRGGTGRHSRKHRTALG